jgi:hypothetical protein
MGGGMEEQRQRGVISLGRSRSRAYLLSPSSLWASPGLSLLQVLNPIIGSAHYDPTVTLHDLCSMHSRNVRMNTSWAPMCLPPKLPNPADCPVRHHLSRLLRKDR